MNAVFEPHNPELRAIPWVDYIGTKRVRAVQMTRLEYVTLREWHLPADEDGADEGYLIEYVDGGKPNMAPVFDGYVSWSPKDVFERSYRPETGIGSFSNALDALKAGYTVTRQEWQARATCLKIVDGEIFYARLSDARDTGVPWLNATNEELLADDWMVVI